MSDQHEEEKSELQRLRDRLESYGLMTNITGMDDPKPPPVSPITLDGIRDLLQLSPQEFADTFEEKVDTLISRVKRSETLAEEIGDKEMAKLFAAEVKALTEEADLKSAAELAEAEGKYQMAKLLRGEVKVGNAAHDALVAYAKNDLGAQEIEELVEKKPTYRSLLMQTAAAGSGLPPAPDWNTLEAYVEPLLRDIVDHVKGLPVLQNHSSIGEILPFDVLRGVDMLGEELLNIVGERGAAYGEEVILALGESGMIMQIMSKVMRLMWNHRAGMSFETRRDSYIDLAGYCLLAISLDAFIRGERDGSKSKDGVSGGTST